MSSLGLLNSGAPGEQLENSMLNRLGRNSMLHIRYSGTMLLAILLFAQASALPVHIGLLLLPPHTAAMTHGCEKGTCCTALCFLDKHGNHHCVHMSGDSCECGISTEDCTGNTIFLSAIVVLYNDANLLPDFVSSPWISPVQTPFEGREPITPSPPPK